MQLYLIVLAAAGAWVAGFAVVLALCRAAAAGDRVMDLNDVPVALRAGDSGEDDDVNDTLAAPAHGTGATVRVRAARPTSRSPSAPRVSRVVR
jgi:hypothetical protein